MANKRKSKLTKAQVVAEVKRTLKAAKQLVLDLQKVDKDVEGSPFGGQKFSNCPPFSRSLSKRRRR